MGTRGAPDTEEVRIELRAILDSSAFRRSERQARFLRYVCEMALKGEGSKLSEYVIAHEVFGRGSEYSPGEDSIVRRQAHSLRQRIAEYYAAEGGQDRIRIELPVGRYVPVFVRKEPLAKPQGLVLEQVQLPLQESRWRPVLWVTGALLLLMTGWFLGRLGTRNQLAVIDAGVKEIWRPWLTDADGAVICLSNPLTTVVKQFSFSLPSDVHGDPPRIVANTEQANQLREYFNLPQGGHFFLYPARSQSKTGEALGSVTMTSLLTKAGVSVRSTQSRFLNWDNFRRQNLILLGHDEANRWLDPILNRLPIRMATTDGEKARRIVVTEAAPGRTTEFYFQKAQDSVARDYALVSMVDGIDNRHQLLLINGLNTEGTQIAMEYLCDPNTVRTLLQELRKASPNHHGSWHFQFVLRTEVRDQVPTETSLLLVKVL